MNDFNKIIDRKNTYCTQWDFIQDRFGKNDLLPFTISDMDFQSPKILLNAFKKRIDHGVFGYTRWNNPDFLMAIEQWYKKKFNYKIDATNILCGPGVVYLISKILSLINPLKENIAIFSPCYDGFLKIIASNNYPLLTIPLNNKDNISDENIEHKIAKSKVLILCNPNNPNGKLWHEKELEEIINICKRHNTYIISDDVHMDIVYKPNKFTPILKVAEKLDYMEKVIIVTSTSKTFNTAGINGAYAIIPSKTTYNNMNKILVTSDSVSSSSVFFVTTVITGYSHCEEWLNNLLDYCHNNLKEVKKFILENMPNLKVTIPEATYFAYINCEDLGLSSAEIQNKLINKGKVAIMSGDLYSSKVPHLRLNVACPMAKVQDGLERLKISLK